MVILFSRVELFVQFCKEHYEEYFCEITLKLNQWFRMACRLNIFLNYSSGGPCVQRSGTGGSGDVI